MAEPARTAAKTLETRLQVQVAEPMPMLWQPWLVEQRVFAVAQPERRR